MTQNTAGDAGACEAVQLVPVYDSASTPGGPMREGVEELFRYKDLLRLLVTTNIKTRYKRSILGVAWTLLSPLLTMIVMSITLGKRSAPMGKSRASRYRYTPSKITIPAMLQSSNRFLDIFRPCRFTTP